MSKGRNKKKKNSQGNNDDAQSPSSKKPAKSSNSSFKAFLKKRALIYLGLVALFLVFVVPEFTKGSINDVMPELANAEDQRIVDMLMDYSGPDGSGLDMRKAISEKIVKEFGERIFSHQDTKIDIAIITVAATADMQSTDDSEPEDTSKTYDVEFAVQTHKGNLNYTWIVNAESGKVTSDDQPSKNIVNIVNFSD